MKRTLFSPLQIILSIVGYFYATTTQAQVTTDSTVNTQVNQNGNVAEITGGETRGSNLFHSFQDFSVPTGNEAFFNNAESTSNIFSRVTGGNISNIDGVIRNNGSASLFLINPAGILFGANARLDIGGSFYGSTADSILFPNDIEFSTSNSQVQPILTINAPIGLSFRDNPKDIEVTGATLEVESGQDSTFIGGNISLDGASLIAPGGRVELGGLSVAGEVGLSDVGSLSFTENLERADISLTNNAEVNVLDEIGGSININARNLELTEQSTFITGTQEGEQTAETQAGNITINVTASVFLNGSSLNNQVDENATGNAGNLEINTGILSLTNRSLILADTKGEGDAGNISINAAEKVTLRGTSDIVNGAGLLGDSAEGNGGDIVINTKSLELSSGSSLFSLTNAQGDAGNIIINASEEVLLSGQDENSTQDQPTQLNVQVQENGEGNGGNIEINTSFLSLANRSLLLADTKGQGDAGNISINADEKVTLRGTSDIVNGAGLLGDSAEGNGGDIVINTKSLELSSGSSLFSLTNAQGDAGNIIINASEEVLLSGQDENSTQDQPTQLNVQVNENATGNAGNLEINTGILSLTNRSLILANTKGQGNSGNITINALEKVTLKGASDIVNGVGLSGSLTEGDGGNIIIDTKSLELSNGSSLFSSTNAQGNAGNIIINASETISLDGEDQGGGRSAISNRVEATGVGDAGNIEIDTPNLSLVNGGVISASTLGQGNGGSIIINSSDSISLEGEDQIGFRSSILNRVEADAVGDAGDINLTTSNLSLTNGGRISATVQSSSSQGNAGDINITATDINLFNNGEINASVLGQGNAGNIFIQANDLSLDGGRVFAINQPSGENTSASINLIGGNVTLKLTDNLILRNNSSISARAFEVANGGNLDIDARFIIAFPDGNNDILASAQQGQGGNIAIDAESLFGIQQRPLSNLTNDINASSEFSLDGSVTINTPDINPVEGVTELPVDIIVPEETTQQACEANRQIVANNGFSIKGKGGIPPEPGEPLNSQNIFINGEIDSTSTIPEPIETSQGKIQPARGIKVTESGKIMLTAYRTDNSGERIPEIKRNCGQV